MSPHSFSLSLAGSLPNPHHLSSTTSPYDYASADISEVYPGTKLSTMDEMFDFVDCATSDPVLYNIETKVNPEKANATRSPEDFIAIMDKSFAKKDATFMDRITHQSFDVSLLLLSFRSC